jgi:hypothetical protein
VRAFAVQSLGEVQAIHDLSIPTADGAFLTRVSYAGDNPVDYKLLRQLTSASTYGRPCGDRVLSTKRVRRHPSAWHGRTARRPVRRRRTTCQDRCTRAGADPGGILCCPVWKLFSHSCGGRTPHHRRIETSARLRAQVERKRSGSRRAGITPVVAQRRGSPRRHFGHKPWSPVERVNTTLLQVSPRLQTVPTTRMPAFPTSHWNEASRVARGIARALESLQPRRKRRANLGTLRVGKLGPVARIHNPQTLNSTRSEIKTDPKSRNYSLLREIVRNQIHRPVGVTAIRDVQVPGLV